MRFDLEESMNICEMEHVGKCRAFLYNRARYIKLWELGIYECGLFW